MIEKQKRQKTTIYRDYGTLIRLVTGQTVTEFAQMLGYRQGMISQFESGVSTSQSLINEYNALIEGHDLEPIYEAICARRELASED